MELVDRECDPEWLECVIEDLWDLVKIVRRRSGPRERKYTLVFGLKSTVEVTIQRVHCNGGPRSAGESRRPDTG